LTANSNAILGSPPAAELAISLTWLKAAQPEVAQSLFMNWQEMCGENESQLQVLPA
jgi:hypothetical protein